ncbi:hypothetical protein NM688_g3362 [Phlebia brevispora]|uniref:Uncharacterized protein n=1 Tax=Phlebia brevispora TaxID=194682 RepID=A0ACC1T6N5_9APHY|nr:hypothetical protein NM688_g3362 [Phlebia brevispora]
MGMRFWKRSDHCGPMHRHKSFSHEWKAGGASIGFEPLSVLSLNIDVYMPHICIVAGPRISLKAGGKVVMVVINEVRTDQQAPIKLSGTAIISIDEDRPFYISLLQSCFTVHVFVISPDTRSERRFDLNVTIEQLKNKLELFTGIPVQNQQLLLFNNEKDEDPIAILSDEHRPLGFYGVVDTNPATSFTGQLGDISQVEKYELSEEAYAERQDTVLAYKRKHKIGRFADQDGEPEKHVAQVNIPIGSRCQVESSEEDFHKRGTVRFVGSTQFGSGEGIWVGIEYDEPIGKNDGSVKGVRYFSCKPNYGVFVRPERVEIGEFPVEEINFEDEEM